MAPNERNKSNIFKYHFSGTMENIVLSLLINSILIKTLKL